MNKLFPLFVSASIVTLLVSASGAQQAPGSTGRESGPQIRKVSLAPTAHAPVPSEPSQFWLAPDRSAATRHGSDAALSEAIRLQSEGNYPKALEILIQPATRQGPLGMYAAYYAGVAQLRLARPSQALGTFQAVQAQKPSGYLAEATALGEAESHEALNDHAAASAIYETLLAGKATNVEDVLMRLGRAAKAAGQLEKAAAAYARVYYEFALSEVAPTAGTELAQLTSAQNPPDRSKLDLARAERFYEARQYGPARGAFASLRAVSAEDRDLVDLRLAECDYYLKKARSALDALKRFAEGGSRQAEALHFYALALRDVGERDESVKIVGRIVEDFPAEPWAADALNALAGFYVVKDSDDLADRLFRELCERYPRSRHSERAAWKVGWRAYRNGAYAETARFFEQGAVDFPRSDYRPGWLYWSGRAHDQLNETALARERYALAITDYRNTYYGRLAQAHLEGAPKPAAVVTSAGSSRQDVVLPPSMPPNATVIRTLLGVELYDDALNELRYAQKTWGDSPQVQATIAWTHGRQARAESGVRRFQLLRSAITGMRRAYPQFLAAGGEDLPRELLTVIFPIAYWDLIRQYSAEYELDPYFVAALVGQESTFVADIRSKANAVGLMQLMPATARMYANKLSLRYTTRLSTDPESNIRMGMAYLADKIKEFGEPHLALASYNAGERAVRRWLNERPGLGREEFIDDIPYPETQNYVKRILGTADDYRRLYGDDRLAIDGVDITTAKAPSSPGSKSVASGKATTGATSPTRSTAPKRPAKARKAA